MSEKSVTIIISDLHVGGGPADPGDDHVYQGKQFQNFIAMLGATSEGKAGEIELFINGDFLEFAQVNPSVYQLGSAKYWCSEAESMQKLEPILNGHPDLFAALRQFGGLGNQITMSSFSGAMCKSAFRKSSGRSRLRSAKIGLRATTDD